MNIHACINIHSIVNDKGVFEKNNRITDKLTSCVEHNQLAYGNLVDTGKTAPTRYLYDKSVKYFMRYFGFEDNDYEKLLDPEPKMIQANISAYIVFLRDQKRLVGEYYQRESHRR